MSDNIEKKRFEELAGIKEPENKENLMSEKFITNPKVARTLKEKKELKKKKENKEEKFLNEGWEGVDKKLNEEEENFDPKIAIRDIMNELDYIYSLFKDRDDNEYNIAKGKAEDAIVQAKKINKSIKNDESIGKTELRTIQDEMDYIYSFLENNEEVNIPLGKVNDVIGQVEELRNHIQEKDQLKENKTSTKNQKKNKKNLNETYSSDQVFKLDFI